MGTKASQKEKRKARSTSEKEKQMTRKAKEMEVKDPREKGKAIPRRVTSAENKGILLVTVGRLHKDHR